jgi:hypothetical protein
MHTRSIWQVASLRFSSQLLTYRSYAETIKSRLSRVSTDVLIDTPFSYRCRQEKLEGTPYDPSGRRTLYLSRHALVLWRS